jgi:hypothetical protein
MDEKPDDDCCTLTVTGRSAAKPAVRGLNPLTFSTCYLCGKDITGESSRDHVPPKQFFPKVFRKSNAIGELEWLPTHQHCNHSYQIDEDYFVTTFGLPSAVGTPAGHALAHDIRDRYRRGEQQGLVNKVLNEFAPGTNQKAFASSRTHRVAWKIVRGLHCLRTGVILPERATVHGDFTCEKTRPFLRDLDGALLAAGFNDPWEGPVSSIFKARIFVDQGPAVDSYTYVFVCWEYLMYFLSFQMSSGKLLE